MWLDGRELVGGRESVACLNKTVEYRGAPVEV